MPKELVARANWGIAHIEDWDLEALADAICWASARWWHRLRQCAACDREPVFDVVGTATIFYCDLCRAEAAA